MGQQVSRVVGTFVKRPMQRFNVDHRAAKVIAKIEDPRAPAMRAPMYQSDKELLEAVRASNPTLAEAMQKKDSDFDDRLKDVYVTSTDPPEDSSQQQRSRDRRPLPMDCSQHSYDFIPGSLRKVAGQRAPLGRVSLDEAVDLLTRHAERPDFHTASTLSDQFKVDTELTAAVLKYVRIYKMMKPELRLVESRDPLAVGKDWVEDAKLLMQPGPGVNHIQAQNEEMKRLLQLQEKRAKEQKLLEGESPQARIR